VPGDFASAVEGLGFSLGSEQMRQLAVYRDAITAAAARFSLTAVREPAEIERRHFIESLALGRALVELGALAPEGACRALDLGSGAGLPGLPLRIAWPRMTLTLLDANGKRCRFLRETVAALGLSGVRVLEGRAEDYGHDPAHRASYDLVLARAVAPLPVLLEYALPFLKIGGRLAAPKGGAARREVEQSARALSELGGEIESLRPFVAPGGREQTLLVIRKAAPTPDRYPRRAGVARKRPLR